MGLSSVKMGLVGVDLVLTDAPIDEPPVVVLSDVSICQGAADRWIFRSHCDGVGMALVSVKYL